MSSTQVRYMDSSGMDPYPEYKDSGIEWIGEIPEHWDTSKIKWLSPVKRGASPRPIDDPIYFDDDGDFAWVRIADVTASERYLENTTQKLSELGSSLSVKQYPNDFLLSIAGTVGKPIITKIKCCIHDGFVWFPELKINSEYLYYLFSSGEPYKGLGKLGTQLNLNTETVGNIKIPLPSTEKELDDVINFLDRETSRIDALVEKKQQFIELLEERRSALISHAVTKGLDPDVPMKDSGIEWIGEIPQHWDVVKLKRLCKIINGSTPKSSESEYWDGDIVWITPSDLGKVTDSVIHDSSRRITQAGLNSCGTTLCPENSIIVSTRAPIGHIAITKVKTCTNQGCRTLIPEKNVCKSKYIYYYLHTSNNILNSLGQGSTFMELSNHYISNFEVPSPPLQEQQSIADHLNKKTSQIDTLITKTETSIEYLKEYRTALISSAVTGKIDVRGTVND